MKGLNTMRKFSASLIALVGIGVMAGCTTNNTVGNPQFTTHAKLQLAVGTLNDSFGTLTSVPGTYLNAVSTFRNQNGASAFINPGTPTFTLPGGGTVNVCGLFSYGQNPATMIAPILNNPPPPPPSPGPIGSNAPAFGIPPAYSPANSNGIGYALGYLLYFDTTCSFYVLPPAATPGAYTLSTTVSTNGKSLPFTATATLGATPTVLPAETAPSYVSGGAGSGGGTFTITQPAGVTESLIMIVTGTNSSAITPNVLVASIETSTTTAVVPPGTLAPGTYSAYVIGADYPLFESGPPNSTSQAPTIVGAGGTADTTVSSEGPVMQN
jgi:hypothetical protein